MRYLLLLMSVLLILPVGAGAAEGAMVGDLANLDLLRLSGNATFSRSSIIQALGGDVTLAAVLHPLAPRAELPAAVGARLEAGYRSKGFPHAQVRCSVVEDRLEAVITEGERFTCGDILIEGAVELPATAIRQELIGSQPGAEADPGRPRSPLWGSGVPPRFDQEGWDQLGAGVVRAYGRSGRHAVRFTLVPLPRPDGRADLRLSILDEGPVTRVAGFRWSGLERTRAEDAERTLGLAVGVVADADLPRRLTRQLEECGRFRTQRVEWDGEPGRGLVAITVLESRNIPPLPTALTPAGEALVRCAAWLRRHLAQGGSDAVIELDWEGRHRHLTAVLGAPERGLLVTVQGGGTAVSAAICGRTLLLRGGGRGLTRPVGGLRFTATLGLVGAPDQPQEPGEEPPVKDAGSLSFAIAADSPRASSPGFALVASLATNPLLTTAYDPRIRCATEDGLLVLRREGLELRLDPVDGRLVSLTSGNQDLAWSLRFVPGALAEARQRLESGPEDLSGGAPEAVQSALVALHQALAGIDGQPAPGGEQVRLLCRLLGLVLPQLAGSSPVEGADGFDFAKPIEATSSIPWAIAQLFHHAQAVVATHLGHGAWPVAMLRGATMYCLGRHDLVRAEVAAQATDPALGPVACLAWSRVLGLLGQPAARGFATIGRSRLEGAAFAREVRILAPLLPVLAPALATLAREPACWAGLPPAERELVAELLAPWRAAGGDLAGQTSRLEAAALLLWERRLRAPVAEALGSATPVTP
jgi:hypothetical protein